MKLNMLTSLEKRLFGNNQRFDEVHELNAKALQRVEAFRREPEQPGAKPVHKMGWPYYGIVPCRASKIDFLMFQANDDIVALHYLWHGADGYETQMVRRWVEWCRSVGVVLDIGGYSGLMSILACKANPKNEVHYFEPIEATVERANINFKINGVIDDVIRHRVAASDSEREERINVFRSDDVLPTGSSLHVIEGRQVHDSRHIRTVAIDSYLPDMKPTVIKIDVEGHELACLKGLHRTIQQSRPRLMIEVWAHTRSEVLGMLRNLDYDLERVEQRDLRVNNYFATPK